MENEGDEGEDGRKQVKQETEVERGDLFPLEKEMAPFYIQ